MPRFCSVASHLNVADKLCQEAVGLEEQRNQGESPPCRGHAGQCPPACLCASPTTFMSSRASRCEGVRGATSPTDQASGCPSASLLDQGGRGGAGVVWDGAASLGGHGEGLARGGGPTCSSVMVSPTPSSSTTKVSFSFRYSSCSRWACSSRAFLSSSSCGHRGGKGQVLWGGGPPNAVLVFAAPEERRGIQFSCFSGAELL